MAEKHNCPVCGKFEFEERGSYDICKVCGWEDDQIQEEDHNYKGGANKMSVNEAKEAYKKGEPII